MKRFRFILILLFFIFLCLPNLKAEDSVKIKSIVLESKSFNTNEKTKPSFNGLDLNFDLEFRELNDYIKYKIIVENNTDKDFFIDKDLNFTDSNYLKYNYYTEDKIKANSETVVYLDIVYNNEINKNQHSESNKASIKLLNESGEAALNPDTGESFDLLTLVVLVLIAFVTLGIFNKESFIKLGVFMICILPIITMASEMLKIGVNINVIIQKGYKFGYVIEERGFIIPYEEKDKYDLSKTTCIDLYVEDYSASDRFIVCDRGVIYMEDRVYAPGDVIYYSYPNRISLIDENYVYNNCEINEENMSAYCKDIRKLNYFSAMYYGTDIIDEFGFTYFDNDMEKMKFFCDNDSECSTDYFTTTWHRDGYIDLYYFQDECLFDFRMPEHDVLFGYGIREV